MTSCSTHVLDAVLGVPAAGMSITLRTGPAAMETALTDADGRVRFAADLRPGDYSIIFATGAWFDSHSRLTFYPEVAIAFTVAEGLAHVHVPLLLSPYAYTTYRGS